jgi:hypothetical protein
MMDTTTSALIKRSNFKRMGNLILARIDSRQTRDFLVPLFWTLVVGIELYLLLNDITLFHSPKFELPEITGERIGVLRELNGGVRWQNPKDVVWNESRTGQALYDGQSLLTLSDSNARLVFDGESARSTELDIGAKTLLELRTRRKDGDRPILLSLTRGTFRARTNRAMELAAGELSVRIEPGSQFEAENLEGTRTPNGKHAVRFTLRNGRAHVGSKQIEANQSIDVPFAASEPTVVTEASPIVPSPTPEATPTPTSVPTPKPARVRALPPPNLQSPILRRRSPRPAPSPEKSGAWFFDFFFPNAEAAEPEPDEWELELRWDAVPNAREYRVEVARTRAFTNKIAEERTPEAHWNWLYRRGMENSKGRIFYRIASVDSAGKIGKFSEPKVFVIPGEILHPTTLSPPVAAESAAPTPPPAPRLPSTVAWGFRPAVEMTSLTQTSDDPELKRVSPESAYAHEALEISRTSPDFRWNGSVRANHFKGDPAILPKTRSYRVALTGERETRWLGGHLAIGAVLVYEDVFVKTGMSSLGVARALSLGPSATYSGMNWIVGLRLPLTGAIGKGWLAGPFGPSLHFERDWSIGTLGSGPDRTRVLASFSGDGSYHFWSSGTTTTVAEWSVGLGPKLEFR